MQVRLCKADVKNEAVSAMSQSSISSERLEEWQANEPQKGKCYSKNSIQLT